MNLSYLGPVSCVFSSWVSSGCTLGGGCSILMIWWQVLCLYPESPQDSVVVADGYNILIWQVAFLVHITMSTPAHIWLHWTGYIFFHLFAFNLFVSLSLKCALYRLHIVRSCFFTHSAYTYILIGIFNSFTFNVITVKVGFMPAFLPFVFYMSFLFLYSYIIFFLYVIRYFLVYNFNSLPFIIYF